MIQLIESINVAINNFVWGVPAMVCIIGVGLYLSIRTRFLQIRKFPYAIKTTIGRMFRKRDASDGALTPFQAVCTALAATVGTGNIAGVAGAIAIGGPGAVFWMWVSAMLGMCTKFAEVTLAVHFRERNADGELVGGPMYYIKNGLGKKWQWLAVLFSVFGVLTVFGTGNATQVNTITASINSALLNYHIISEDSLGISNLILGILLAAVVGMVLLGGIKRIGHVTERLVPFMALFYIILAVGVVLLNIQKIPEVFYSIFYGAFHPAAFTGGVVGSFFLSMQKGVSRGIFSNEAGLGTGSIAHACADTKKPVKQGLFGIFEVLLTPLLSVLSLLWLFYAVIYLLPMARLPELSLRFLVLLLPMGTGFLSLLLLPCAVLLFPPSSDGVYMAPDVLNFCFLQKSSNLLWLFILWLPSWALLWIWDFYGALRRPLTGLCPSRI